MPPKPTPAELDILRVLWTQGPSTVRSVHTSLGPRTGYTSVLKLMQIMADKKLVSRDESSRTHIYTPLATESQTQRRLVSDLLDKAFDGSARKLMLAALSGKKTSPRELAEIRKLIDDLERRLQMTPPLLAAPLWAAFPSLSPQLYPLSTRIAWTLLHSTWQCAALACLLFLTLLLTPRAHSRLRYAFCCLALLAAFLSSLVTFSLLSPVSAVTSSHTYVMDLHLPPLPIAPLSTEIATPITPSHSAPPPAPVLTHLTPYLPTLTLLWSIGVFLLAIRHLAGWLHLQRLKHTQTTPPSPDLLSRAARLAQRLGIRRPITLLQSTLATTPAVISYFRPIILLPAALAADLTIPQLESILAHELAHIRRHDYLANLLQTAIETLFFYHPAIWYISHQTRHERENCCDDLAVSITTDPLIYARALTRLEELRCSTTSLAPAATGPNLRARIHRILRLRAPRRRPIPLPAILLILLCAATCLWLTQHAARAATLKKSSPTTQPSSLLPDEHADAMAWLLKEYPAAAKKLEDAYSSVRAVGKTTELDENNNIGEVLTFDDARKAGAFRSLISVVKQVKADMDRSPPGLRAVFGGTADLYFSLNKDPGDAKWKFDWYGPRPDFVTTEQSTMPELFAVTHLDATPVAGILTESEITAKSAAYDTFEGKKVVTIQYAGQNKEPGKSRLHSHGTIRLIEPSLALLTWHSVIWDVTSPVAPEDQGLTFNYRVEYSQLEPVPKVSKVERWRSKAGKKLDHAIAEIKELDFGDLPDAEFQLQFYGIPKPDHLITPGLDEPKSGTAPGTDATTPAHSQQDSPPRLQFRSVLPDTDPSPADLVENPAVKGQTLRLSKQILFTESDLTHTEATTQDSVTLHFTPEAGKRFSDYTASHLGHRLAILLDGKLLVAPNINSRIGPVAVITFTHLQATQIADALNTGKPPTTHPSTLPATSPNAILPEDLLPTTQPYRLLADDLLQITLPDPTPPYAQSTQLRRISPAGTISLPRIGQIDVATLTLSQAQTTIAGAYVFQNILPNPDISIHLAGTRGNNFSIIGDAIPHPGQYPISRPDLHLTDALTTAGGAAPASTIMILRGPPGPSQRQIQIPASSLLGDPSLNLIIRNHDFIIVNDPTRKYIQLRVTRDSLTLADKPLSNDESLLNVTLYTALSAAIPPADRPHTTLVISADSDNVPLSRYLRILSAANGTIKPLDLHSLNDVGVTPTSSHPSIHPIPATTPDKSS